MRSILLGVVFLATLQVAAVAAETAPTKAPPPPARTAVDPALEAEHTRADVKRHRLIAAAHEAAAKCQESGKDEAFCNAELAKACQGIAYGKFCGMKHPD
jgi:hypothetical protein